MNPERMQIVFGSDLQRLLLKGGTIIDYHNGWYESTILVRMPKNKWEQHPTGKPYEYIQFDQGREDNSMWKANWRNGHVREVKRKAQQDHWEREVHSRLMSEKKAEGRAK